MVRARSAQAAAVAAAAALLTWSLATPVLADTPPPSPVPSASPEGTASSASAPPASPRASAPESPDPGQEPSLAGSPTPADASADAGTDPGPNPQSADPQADQQDADLTLVVAPSRGPVADAFYEDLGSFGFSGATSLPDGSTVQVQRRTADGGWTSLTSATVRGGSYAATAPVQAAGTATFRASAEGAEGLPVTSASTSVTVRDSSVSLSAPKEVDALKSLPVRGRVVPARAGVEVVVDVERGSAWRAVARTRTAADGTWATSLTYGKGQLSAYRLRAGYAAANRARWERSSTVRSMRIAVLDAKVDPTTAADVAKTYRAGCPVGRSKLSTIHLNHYGRDKRMHRGVIIIRTDLRQEIIRGFGSALEHRYPVEKMKNPNDYGGNDPKQMAANNTSGFNCRKVVGNPYKMSPHSYGIAIDVNTVQNPYRDVNGKWWPSNGRKYRDRTPLRWGMLDTSSWLTRSLRKDGFFWGGLWNPGRDYQHFEYRG